MVLGAAGITIGNWIKVFSIAPDRFYVAFIGQCVSVSFIMLTYGLMGRFTAMWFGAKEISTAGVLSILGDQVITICTSAVIFYKIVSQYFYHV